MSRLVAFACAALIALSACGGAPTPIEPTAKASESPANSSTSSASTLKPPTLPAAAKRNDETGAANFVAYWVKVANFASQTGDTELLRRVSAPGCAACGDYIQLYEKTYDAGGLIRGGLDELSGVEVERGTTEHFVRALVTSSPGSFKASKSSTTRRTPSERLRIIYAARFESSRWLLTQIGVEK